MSTSEPIDDRAASQAPASHYRLAARISRAHATVVRVGAVEFGGPEVVPMAGPCAIESPEQLAEVAARLAGAGVRVLRGGAFKPRTSPYAFQGLGLDGYRILREIADRHDMLVISEVLGEEHIDAAVESIDILQVGSRNMQNFALLKRLAQQPRPVLLKRGMSATYDELLAAAEYLLVGGNANVILCERGIRTFETATRNTFDVAAVPVLKRMSHLPVVVDPSHAAGRSDIVPDLARAAIAAGADGLLVEVHGHPEQALCDGSQALLPRQFGDMLGSVAAIARAVGRRMTLRGSGANEGAVARAATAPRP